MTKIIKCSCCNKRMFDLVKFTAGEMIIEIKCPNCKKIVKVNCKK